MSSPNIERKIASRAKTRWDFCGMGIDSHAELRSPRPEITTELVKPSNFSEFLEVNLAGWELGAFREQTEEKLRRMVTHSAYRCFLARKKGQAVGSGVTVLKEGHGCLAGAVVLKEFRGQGAYQALIQTRLSDLRSLSIPFAVTQARLATSAPILENLGFTTLYRAQNYRF